MRDAIRLRHFSIATEKAYCQWLQSYMNAIRNFPSDWSSEQKVERHLSTEARRGVAASTQNQALNALVFFYKTVLGTPLGSIDAMRAHRPSHQRTALSVEDTRKLLDAAEDAGGYATRLVTWMLYGCGLRVSEPLELRSKDVDRLTRRLMIRGAKGGKDRSVELPKILVTQLEAQTRTARAVWRADAAAGLPVSMPGLIARKSPHLALTEAWAWIFPAHQPILHPRTGERIRWRMHEVNVQRAVRAAAKKVGLDARVTPHVLRHCYATHTHQAGASPRDLQDALGHAHLDTTMRYLTPSLPGVRNPLDGV